MRDGQTALEFVIAIAVALIFGALFLAVANALLSGSAEQERYAALNRIGYTLQDELILASYVSDGYIRRFDMPERAGRFTYTLTSSTNAVTLRSGSTVITYPLPNATGTFSMGVNEIRKEDGEVTIS